MPKINPGDLVAFPTMVDGGIVLTQKHSDGRCLVWWPQYGVCHEEEKNLVFVGPPCIEELLLHEDEHVRKLGTRLTRERASGTSDQG